MDQQGLGLPRQRASRGATTLAPRPESPRTTDPAPGPGAPPRRARRPGVPAISRPAVRHVALLAGCLAAGIAETWPRASYLAGRLPATRDAAGYVWDFWWVAHQVTHLGNPWFTRDIAAPVGAHLGYHTLMPLPGLLMTPVTLTLGPAASYNLLSVACPGLLAYVMYRAARLWLPEGIGAAGAGVVFGLSPILTWRSWYEVNLAAGALFFPMALEACVRLRRAPGRRQAVGLGVVMGAAVLTDQESAVMTAILAALALLPLLARRPRLGRLRPAALAITAGTVVGGPQLVAMAQQALSGGATSPLRMLAVDYASSGAGPAQLFAPSPRLAGFGLTRLALPYYWGGPTSQVVAGYGVVASLLALMGLVTAWRRRSARLLGLFWAGCSALALGSSLWIGPRPYVPFPQMWGGERVSVAMPFTWFVRLPGLSDFREADRFTELALVATALLAGAALEWLWKHAWPALVVVVALGLLETGWSGNPALGSGTIGTMPASFPALDAPIAASHSRSLVVDLPFGLRGGLPVLGGAFPPQTMVMATADGHPLADAYISRIPDQTRHQIAAIPFYAGLLRAQGSRMVNTPADVRAARVSARRLDIGWVVDWEPGKRGVTRLLAESGFRLSYRADGAWVYRPAPPERRPARHHRARSSPAR